MIVSNKGMYLEEVINRSIDFFKSKHICYFEKRFVPFRVLRKLDQNRFFGMLQSKSTADYFGFVNNEHIEFEAKETTKEYFCVSQLLDHQYEWLKMCVGQMVKTYVVILFTKYEEFFIIPFEFILEHKRHSKIPRTELIKKFTPEKIIFPGIVNFVKKM